MTMEEMQASLEVWDMAIGCNVCGQHSWGTTAHPLRPEDFHADGCPLKGNREVHSKMIDYEYVDSQDHRDYLLSIGVELPPLPESHDVGGSD